MSPPGTRCCHLHGHSQSEIGRHSLLGTWVGWGLIEAVRLDLGSPVSIPAKASPILTPGPPEPTLYSHGTRHPGATHTCVTQRDVQSSCWPPGACLVLPWGTWCLWLCLNHGQWVGPRALGWSITTAECSHSASKGPPGSDHDSGAGVASDNSHRSRRDTWRTGWPEGMWRTVPTGAPRKGVGTQQTSAGRETPLPTLNRTHPRSLPKAGDPNQATPKARAQHREEGCREDQDSEQKGEVWRWGIPAQHRGERRGGGILAQHRGEGTPAQQGCGAAPGGWVSLTGLTGWRTMDECTHATN